MEFVKMVGTKSNAATSITGKENDMHLTPNTTHIEIARPGRNGSGPRRRVTTIPDPASAQPVGGLASDPDSPTGWMGEGNCRMYPPATFFPSDGVGVDRARKICAGCPVLDTCLEYALQERIEHGVWGGCSERERRRILKRRRLDAVSKD
jgi:WhiB family redox-sensing transcriptional regulator